MIERTATEHCISLVFTMMCFSSPRPCDIFAAFFLCLPRHSFHIRFYMFRPTDVFVSPFARRTLCYSSVRAFGTVTTTATTKIEWEMRIIHAHNTSTFQTIFVWPQNERTNNRMKKWTEKKKYQICNGDKTQATALVERLQFHNFFVVALGLWMWCQCTMLWTLFHFSCIANSPHSSFLCRPNGNDDNDDVVKMTSRLPHYSLNAKCEYINYIRFSLISIRSLSFALSFSLLLNWNSFPVHDSMWTCCFSLVFGCPETSTSSMFLFCWSCTRHCSAKCNCRANKVREKETRDVTLSQFQLRQKRERIVCTSKGSVDCKL